LRRDLIPATEAETLLGQRVVIDDRRHGRIIDGMRATSPVTMAGRRRVVHVVSEETWWRWALTGVPPTPRVESASHVYVEGRIA
jgi:hypothetical protein